MSSIDERVVQMRFDNKQFETGVKQTLSSLDKLKDSLSFDKVSKGFESVENAISKVTFEPVAKQIEALNSRFSAFGTMSRRVLENIADSAYRTGVRVVKSLSVDNVSSGWDKFAKMTSATATLQAAMPGEAAEKVERTLADLQDYADKTSFSLTDMTANLSTFISQGVDLDVATESIKGIGNAASIAGASIPMMSHAMIGFSKALGRGYMMSNEWEWIRTAGMDIKEFKTELLEGGVAAGTLERKVDKAGNTIYETTKLAKKAGVKITYQNFNDAFAAQAITADAITNTLQRYSAVGTELGDRGFEAASKARTFQEGIDAIKDAVSSGWMISFQHMFGTMEEASDLWTNASNAVIDFAYNIYTARNALLKGWKEAGGRDSMLNALRNVWATFNDLYNLLSEGFGDVFGHFSVDNLLGISSGIESFTASVNDWLHGIVYLDGKPVRRLSLVRNVIQGVASGFKLAAEIAKQFGKFVGNVFRDIFPSGKGDSLLTKLADKAKELRDNINQLVESGKIEQWFTGLQTSLEPVTSRLAPLTEAVINFAKAVFGLDDETKKKNGTFLENLQTWVSDGLVGLGELMQQAIDWLTNPENIENTKKWWTELTTSISEGVGKVTTALEPVGNFIANIFNKDKGTASVAEDAEKTGGALAGLTSILGKINVMDVAKAIMAVRSLIQLHGTIKKLKKVKQFLSVPMGIVSSLKDTIDAIKNRIDKHNYFEKLHDFANGVIKLAFALLVVAAAVRLLAGLKPAQIGIGVAAVGALLAEMALFLKYTKKNELTDAPKKLFRLASALFMMALSVRLLNSMDPMSVSTGVIAIGALMAELALFMYAVKKNELDKTVLPKFNALARAILMMSFAVRLIGTLSLGQAAVGVASLGVLLIALSIFLEGMKKLGVGMKDGAQLPKKLGILAISLLIMAASIRILGTMNIDQALIGVGSIGAVFAALAWFLNSLKTMNVESAPSKMLGLSLSIVIISAAIKMLGDIKTDGIISALAAIGGSLIMIAYFSKFMSDNKLGSGAPSFLLLAASLLIMTQAVAKLAAIESPAKLTDAVLAIGMLLLLVALYNTAMAKIKGTTAASASFGIIGGAVSMLADALSKLAQYSFPEMLDALAAIGLMLLGLAGISKLMEQLMTEPNWKVLLGFVPVAGAVWILAQAITPLAKIKFTSLFKAILGIGAMMLALGIMVHIMGKSTGNFGSMMGTLVGAVAAAALMIVLAVALNMVQDIDPQAILNFGLAIAAISVGLTALAAVLGILGPAGAAKAAASFVILAAGLGAGVAILGAIVAGTIERFGQTINILGANLKIFSDDMSSVEDGVGERAITLVGQVATAALIAAGVDIGRTDAFRLEVFKLGNTLRGFSNNMKEVGAFTGLKASLIISSIASVAGTINSIPDVKDLADTIQRIGAAIGLYNDILAASTTDESTGETKVNTAGFKQIFAELAADMPDTGALSAVSMFAHDGGGLGEFALGIESLKGALSGFSTAMKDVSPDDIQTGIDALSKFKDIQNQLGDDWSVSIQGFIGGITSLHIEKKAGDLTSFADNIEQLGGGLASFAKSLAGYTTEDFDVGTSAAKTLQEISKALPTSGAFWEFITGKQSLANFGADIGVLGTNLGTFGTSVSGIEGFSEAVPVAVTAISDLANVVGTLDKIGGIASWFTGERKLSAITDGMGGDNGMGAQLADFGTRIADTDFTKVNEAVGIIDGLAAALARLSGADTLYGWSTISQVLYDMAQWTGDELTSASTGEVYGENMLAEFVDFVNTNLSLFGAVISTISSALQSSDNVSQFQQAGSMFASGIVAGITSGAGRIVAAAQMVAHMAVEAFRHIWDEHSPSRVAEDLGKNWDIGLAKGFEGEKKRPTYAASLVATDAVKEARRVLMDPGEPIPRKIAAETWLKQQLGIAEKRDSIIRDQQKKSESEATEAVLGDGSIVGLFGGIKNAEELFATAGETAGEAAASSEPEKTPLVPEFVTAGITAVAGIASDVGGAIGDLSESVSASSPILAAIGSSLSGGLTNLASVGQLAGEFLQNGGDLSNADDEQYLIDLLSGGSGLFQGIISDGSKKPEEDDDGKKPGKTGTGGTGGTGGSNGAGQSAGAAASARTATLNDVIDRIADVEAAVLDVSYAIGSMNDSFSEIGVTLDGKTLIGHIDKELGKRARR